jgi:uncharacterized repeat protein (TIGR03803 family)
MKATAHITTQTLALERSLGSPSLVIMLAGAFLIVLSSARLTAQTFTTLHSFTTMSTDSGIDFACPYTNSDGAIPNGPLVLSSNALYGTTQVGSSGAGGIVFALNTDGSGFTTLLNFSVGTSVGYLPYEGLVLSSDALTFYGATGHSLDGTQGVMFSINTDGTGFAPLYTLPDIGSPQASLILSSGTLYGTATMAGPAGHGAVFSINTDGTGYQALYSFTLGTGLRVTNTDGAYPQTQLVLSGSTLYGITENGGGFGKGTVFAVNTDGTGFRVLHTFTGGTDGGNDFPPNPIGNPRLVLSGNTLYGTASGFGRFYGGTVFSLNTDGSGFKVLHSFGNPLDNDGATPSALVTSGGALYGTARNYGSFNSGTVFKLGTDGTGFTVLHNFRATVGPSFGCGGVWGGRTNSDGVWPNSLILSGDALYGTTSAGGGSGLGTVFSLSLLPVIAPQLAITRAGENVVLTWPTNAGNFFLQSTTNLVLSPVWAPVSAAQVVVNGQNTVTNRILGTQQFYQLVQ